MKVSDRTILHSARENEGHSFAIGHTDAELISITYDQALHLIISLRTLTASNKICVECDLSVILVAQFDNHFLCTIKFTLGIDWVSYYREVRHHVPSL